MCSAWISDLRQGVFLGCAITDTIGIIKLRTIEIRYVGEMPHRIVAECGGAPDLIGNGFDEIASVGELETLAARMGKAREQAAGPSGSDGVAIGILNVVQFAIR